MSRQQHESSPPGCDKLRRYLPLVLLAALVALNQLQTSSQLGSFLFASSPDQTSVDANSKSTLDEELNDSTTERGVTSTTKQAPANDDLEMARNITPGATKKEVVNLAKQPNVTTEVARDTTPVATSIRKVPGGKTTEQSATRGKVAKAKAISTNGPELNPNRTFEEEQAFVASNKFKSRNMFGFLIQTHKQPKATLEVMQSIQIWMPNMPIYLVSSGGYHYDPLAARYPKNVHYFYDPINTAVWLLDNNRSDPRLLERWFDRIAVAATWCNCDYLIYMEEDTIIRQKVTEKPPFDAGGVRNDDYRWPKGLVDHFGAGNWSYKSHGMCGGSYLRVEAYLDAYNRLNWTRIAAMKEYDIRIGVDPDITLALLMMDSGYTLYPWYNITGQKYHRFSKYAKILHNSKAYYNKPLAKFDGLVVSDNLTKTVVKIDPATLRSSRLNVQNYTGIPRGKEPVGRENDVVLTKDSSWQREISRNDTNLLFVHVGGTGGASLRRRLLVGCYFDSSLSPANKTKCSENMLGGDSQVSQQSVALMHRSRIRGAASDWSQINAFLFPVDDPVERFIKWFYHTKTLSDLKGKWAKTFNECFPTVLKVAKMLQSEFFALKTKCGIMALETMHGKGPENQTNHMFHNFMYYTMRTALKFPKHKVYVVRTTNLWSDFNSIDVMLGGRGNLTPVAGEFDRNSTRRAEDETKSVISSLCCALVEEIDAYRYLLHRAENPVNAMEALNQTYVRCNTPSFEALVDSCPKFRLPKNYQIG